MKNTIKVTNNKQGLQTLQINNEKFDSDPALVFDLPQKSIQKINIDDFPTGIVILPYEMEDSKGYHYTGMKIGIKNNGSGVASLDIEACRKTKDPGYPIGIGCFQRLKAEYILTQKTENPCITIFKIDNTTAHLHYTIELPANTIEHLIELGMKFDEDVTTIILNAMKTAENDIRQKLGLTLL